MAWEYKTEKIASWDVSDKFDEKLNGKYSEDGSWELCSTFFFPTTAVVLLIFKREKREAENGQDNNLQ